MKITKLFIATTALVAIASCSGSDFLGDKEALNAAYEAPISFGSATPTLTRADKGGSDAATDLNNNFVVFGYKTTSSSAKQTVFSNYQVNYVANTANTTTTNSANWEYVGADYKNVPADMTDHKGVAGNTASGVEQSVKFWDFSASNYKFYGYSLGVGNTADDPDTYANASLMSTEERYSLQGTKSQLLPCYISELTTINEPSGSTPKEVDLRFLSIKSKIQLGFYETIPGYSVKLLKFYDSSSDDASDVTPVLFAGSSILPKAGTYTVTFDTSGKPILAWAPAASDGADANVSFSSTLTGYAAREYLEEDVTDAYIGRSSNAATMTEVKEFLPYPDGTNLTLKVDYTLLSRDGTGETIEVKGATATVPSQFAQWKPNYKYTYLFKISDNTNGQVGPVVGLYPITLDAVVASELDGTQETITTVSEPSITTFGYDATHHKYVKDGNEYAATSDIYAVLIDAGSVVTPTLGTNVNVYLATTTNAAAYPITEASVAKSLLEVSAGVKKITLENINADASTNFTSAPAIATDGVPNEDGKYISTAVVLNSQPVGWPTGYYTDKGCIVAAPAEYADGTYYQRWTNALKLTGVKVTTATTALVVEYVKTAATYNTSSSTYTLADETAFNTEISTNGKLYIDGDGQTEATWTYYSTHADATYYRRTSVKTSGAYAYKVIRVN